MKPKSHIQPIPRSRENKKNEAFGLLFQHNPLPMWVYDLETLCFLDVNEAAVEFYGYSRAEFLKMKISDIRPQEDVSRLKKNVKAKRPRLQHSGEWRHCKKDGSIIHVEITSYKLTYEGHKAALVMAKDITRARQAVDAARVAETSYRSLFNSVAEAIYIQDRKGRFLDVNDGAAKMYGYPREFLIGKTPAVISAPGRNDLKKVRRAIKLAFEGQPQEFEFWGLRSNGEAFPKNVRLYKVSTSARMRSLRWRRILPSANRPKNPGATSRRNTAPWWKMSARFFTWMLWMIPVPQFISAPRWKHCWAISLKNGPRIRIFGKR